MSTINAHKIAAQTSLNYIKELAAPENKQVFEQVVTNETYDGSGTPTPVSQKKSLSVPLLALTKVPNETFDSLSVDF